jgi:hypothetical protein
MSKKNRDKNKDKKGEKRRAIKKQTEKSGSAPYV